MLFFDLDGPILDVSEKYYRVYSDILGQNGFNVLAKSEYWHAKREKISEHDILKKSLAGPLLERYLHERKLLIETEPYLLYDSLQNGARDVLELLSKKRDLILVTLRTDHEKLHKQLEYLDLKKYFNAVLSSADQTNPRWKIKYNLINNFIEKKMISDNILVSDTETDIIAGNELGFTTFAVLNGIRSSSILKKATPSFIINSIREILYFDIFR